MWTISRKRSDIPMSKDSITERRRARREQFFKLVYLNTFYPVESLSDEFDRYLEYTSELEEADRERLKAKALDLFDHIGEIDDILNSCANEWKTKRFPSCDLALLRVAVYEMRYDDDVPESVAINEAVELAKKYGTEQSPAFINGVLGKASRS